MPCNQWLQEQKEGNSKMQIWKTPNHLSNTGDAIDETETPFFQCHNNVTTWSTHPYNNNKTSVITKNIRKQRR